MCADPRTEHGSTSSTIAAGPYGRQYGCFKIVRVFQKRMQSRGKALFERTSLPKCLGCFGDIVQCLFESSLAFVADLRREFRVNGDEPGLSLFQSRMNILAAEEFA